MAWPLLMAEDGEVDRRDVLAELVEDAPCGIVVTDPDGRLQYLNTTLSRWLGLQVDEMPLRLSDLLAGPGRLFYETHMAPMMRLQGFVREISCALHRKEDEPLPVLLSGVARRDSEGQLARFDFTIFDARERHSYEEELRIARRSADELAAIVRSSPNVIVRVDQAGSVGSWNAGAERLIGAAAESVLGRPMQQVIRLKNRPNWFDEVIATHDGVGEAVFEATGDRDQEFEVTVAPINERASSSIATHWSVVLRDISKRKAAERRLQLMVDEMRHRVNNTLAVVAGIARQSLSPEESGRFSARLRALSKAHAILAGAESSGADLSLLLAFTAEEAGGPSRFRVAGPEVWLSSRQATSLSMAFHELVTNALKYGALSTPDGHVEVSYGWEGVAGAGRLALVWQERDGPPVIPPTRQGFGTKMIGKVLAIELSADVSFEYQPEGFRCQIAFVPGDAGPEAP